jgi:hypothetical protein
VVLTTSLGLVLLADLITLAQHRAGYPHIVESWPQSSTAVIACSSTQVQTTVDPDAVRAQLSEVLRRTFEPQLLNVWVRGDA